MMKREIKYGLVLLFALFLLCCNSDVFGQPCGPNTPSFIVDLTGVPDSIWISPDTARSDQCCGATFPDRCVEFILTLDTNAEAIIFYIHSGAIPPGALFYQIECSSPILVGEPLCITGTGPHRITFCKPGNNNNEYGIISLPRPEASADITVNDGCTGVITASGYDASSIVWTSIFPDSIGAYDSYLSCTTGCDSILVTAQLGYPPYVDYMACGVPAGGCDSLLVCDTVKIYFNTTLFANIAPVTPTICFGDTGIILTGNGSGGTPPYSYLWSTGDTIQSISVTAGIYWLMVTDTSFPGCPPAFDTVTVIAFPDSIEVDAGPDQEVCSGNPSANLSGTVQVAAGGTWSGGSGTYNPSPDSLNTVYTLDSTEISSGIVTLILTTTGNGSCPADVDTLVITVINFQATVTLTTTNVDCNGDSSGTAGVIVSGGFPPFTYSWNTTPTQTSTTATGLTAGTYTLTITDSLGCDTNIIAAILEPPLLIANITDSTNALCNGMCDGTATVSVSGGTLPYTYLWSGGETTPVAGFLCTGTNTVIVTDSNGCDATASVTINEPTPFTATISKNRMTKCNQCDGDVHIDLLGGTTPYTFSLDTPTPAGTYWWAEPDEQWKVHNICGGETFTVTFTDANGCDTTLTITIPLPPPLIAGITDITNVGCNGSCDGEATVVVTSGTPDFNYSWSPSGGSDTTATGLCAGIYTVYIEDKQKCDTTITVTITEPPLLIGSITGITNASCYGVCDGTATVSASGGTPVYTYQWDDPGTQTDSTATGLCPGNYVATVTDANGCITTVPVTITEPVVLTAAIADSSDVSCNGGSDGQATVSASGGTPFYTYLWMPGGQTSPIATGLTAGTYTVTITDANGCDTALIVIISEPALLVATINFPQGPSCNGGSDGQAAATAIAGTPPYTYSWNTSPVQTNDVVTGLSAGAYTVTITDNNGCMATANVIINEPAPLSLSITTVPANCGNSDGSACVTATGGISPYNYFWNTPLVQNDSCATGLPTGCWDITVTDANGCAEITTACVSDLAVTLDTNSVIHVNCYGGSDGEATVTASGSTPPYTYQWDDPNFQTDSTATGLASGTYNVTATDANGCQVTLQVVVNEPLPIILNVTTTDVSCYSGADGTSTVTVSGEFPPYVYSWTTTPVQTDSTATGLSTGTYTVTITDFNGCDTSVSVVIIEPPLLIADITSSTDVSCNGVSDGSATVTVSGGTTEYTYSWNTFPLQTTPTATGLGPGTYTVTVTDANGCDTTAIVVIVEPPLLTDSISSLVNVSCNGACDGEATVTVSGGTPPYTYSWNTTPAQPTPTVTGLCPGDYILSITDANGCNTTVNITITQPPVFSGSITSANHVSCNGLNDGDATVTVSGGTVPYTYQWDDPLGQTDPMADSLFLGTYNVTVTDANGCIVSLNVTITEPALLTASIDSSIDVSCNGADDGEALVTVTGGTPPYTYSWNTFPVQANADADSLAPGTYTVTITDGHGCNTTASITITEPAILTAGITDSINVSCKGGSDGEATVTVSGGTIPYTYSWDDPSAQTTATATGLSIGTYTVMITDANGCDTLASVVITEPPLLTDSISFIANVSCNGLCDGQATVVVSGGTPPYTYVWNTTPFQSTSIATGLCPGDYTITVTDNNGCIVTDSVTITQPPVLTASITSVFNVSCFGYNDGEATVTPAGGMPPYIYLWDDSLAQTDSTATGLPAGTYTVIVTDANGCVVSPPFAVIIYEPATALVADITDSSDVSCFGEGDGEVTVTASSGTPFYTYLWNTSPPQTTPIATGLLAGCYTVTVTDANGCDTTASVCIGEPLVLNVNITGSTNVSCNGGNDGTANTNISGGTSPYSYSWNTNPVQTGSVATGLSLGTYTITVTDSNNCTAVTTITITEPPPLSLSVSNIPANCGSADGQSTVTVTGGTSPYTYSWNTVPVQTTPIATGLLTGFYTVTVTDSNACVDSAIAAIGDLTVVITLDSLVDVSCNGFSDGQAAITVSGGTSPYTFTWSPAVSSDSTATGLNAGTYFVTAVDFNSCQSTLEITISEPPPIVDSITVRQPACNGGTDGDATVHISGGYPPYTYLWNDPDSQTTTTVLGISAGNYTITVWDAIGCDTTVNVTVLEPSALTVSITDITNVSCKGDSDGVAVVTGSDGILPYTYLWDNDQTTAMATGLSAGTYIAIVTDTNGCMDADTVTITEPDSLIANITSVVNVSCSGACDGEATVTASGGTPGYSYVWNIVPFQSTVTATGLCPGTYLVTIMDANGCVTVDTVTITQPEVLTASITSVTHVSCSGGNDGSATVSGSGGVLPYTYSWNTTPVQTDSVATGLFAGTDTVIVADANGCTVTVGVTINEPILLTADITDSVNVSCFGGFDGQATVTPGGGSGAYNYSWDDDSTQTSPTATGLSAGIYTVVVTDDNGCTIADSVMITEPPLLIANITGSINVSCFGGFDGQATVAASGGTPPYAYSWDDDSTQTDTTATGLFAGTYTVVITDSLGCDTTSVVMITEPALLVAAIADITNVFCKGDSTGAAVVSVTGGTPPYTYSWNTTPVQLDSLATGIPAGTYTVTVTDTLGCDTTVEVTISEPDTLLATITSITNVFCFGDSTGEVTVSVTGGTSPYTYSWSPFGGSDSIAMGLPEGTYTVTVTDTLGCDTTANVIITEGDSIGIAATINLDTICVGMSAVINAFASGGTPALAYTWTWDDTLVTGQGPFIVQPVTPTTYTVTVIDSLGCSKMDSVMVEVNPFLIVFTAPDSICIGETTTISAFVTGGDGDYNFQWSTGPNDTLDSIAVSPQVTTTYLIIVNDGCGTPTAVDSVTVDVNLYPNVDVGPDSARGCEPITIIFTDMIADIPGSSYLWDFGDGATDTIPNPSHTYVVSGDSVEVFYVSVIVTSPQGCATYANNSSTIIVSPYPQANFTAIPKPKFVSNTELASETTILFPTIWFTDRSIGENIDNWQWDFYYPASGSGDSTSTLQNPTHTYTDTGSIECGYCFEVELLVMNTFGCADTIVKKVIVRPVSNIYIPNAFSPNGDGRNDIFRIKGIFIDEETFEMFIYDRWGNLFFETDDINIPWDGTANGGTEIVQQDVYVYLVELMDIFGEEYRFVGTVTVVK